MHPGVHSKVLNLDKAIRKHVGSVNNVSLNEFNKFRYLNRNDMALVKAVPPPRRKRSREMLLTRCGGNPTHAASGMMEDVAIRHRLANLGTFASSVGDHIAKGHVLSRRILMLDWHHTAHCTSEWSWYPGIHAVCQITVNFKLPRFLLGSAKK